MLLVDRNTLLCVVGEGGGTFQKITTSHKSTIRDHQG